MYTCIHKYLKILENLNSPNKKMQTCCNTMVTAEFSKLVTQNNTSPDWMHELVHTLFLNTSLEIPVFSSFGAYKGMMDISRSCSSAIPVEA